MTDKPKTIRVRIPCLVDGKGRWHASNCTLGNSLQFTDSQDAYERLGGQWETSVPAHVVWITAEVPLPDSNSIDVEGEVEGCESVHIDQRIQEKVRQILEERGIDQKATTRRACP